MDGAEQRALESSASQVPLDEAAMIDEVQDLGQHFGQPIEKEPESIIEAHLERLSLSPTRTSSGATEDGKSTLPSTGCRPILKRYGSVPGVQTVAPVPSGSQPPQPLHSAPLLPSGEAGQSTDSLSLTQLRNIVREMPQVNRPCYAFVYKDASSFPEEVEEWFSYNTDDHSMLQYCKRIFIREWLLYNGLSQDDGSAYLKGDIDWQEVDAADRERFVQDAVAAISGENLQNQSKGLETLIYVAFGCWHETAGLVSLDRVYANEHEEPPAALSQGAGAFDRSTVQIEWIKRNVQLICDLGGLQPIYDVFRTCCLRECEMTISGQEVKAEIRAMQRRMLWCTMSLIYLILEVGRDSETSKSPNYRAIILKINPGILLFITEILDRFRWSDTLEIPLTKILLLAWKTILVTFGGLDEIEKAKTFFRDPSLKDENKHGHAVITASPLDYHLFRQEISSKYPAYIPPAPLFPIEPENNSILPPLKTATSRINGDLIDYTHVNGNGASIMNQPIHIATPAPSPPPSPAGPGGKGGKKQNYQTNQLFPFLYPPLDATSNNLGGKGSTDLQDTLVGRKWEGSDIPTSILEAAELFAKRMRATRAMKQLWEERVEYMKYERGWGSAGDDVNIEKLTLEEKENPGKEFKRPKSVESLTGLVADDIESRLAVVEQYYSQSLPYLQSVVMVLLKRILENVAALIAQSASHPNAQGGFTFPDTQNGVNGVHTNGEEHNPFQPDTETSTTAEIDAVRSHEITAKAVSGILILLLKWFKISHILKFEYLTQLLVDDNYIPLILKLLQTQEVERIVHYKCDRGQLDFFYLCRADSRIGLEADSEDEAVPPPIPLHPDHLNEDIGVPAPTEIDMAPMVQVPEVDELGVPTNDVPSSPITHYSWRNFFSSINFLRILQKICKNKAHRNLLLVSYKSSQFLKKCLRVPQDGLRLYTLKLFKNQVPYCGRKWRQSNMRVITAVYLTCRPELRDEWLAGSDVDAEVEESVPLEQALRALTHWPNVKRYPDQMGATKGILNEEQDFFATELAKFNWGEEAMAGDAADDGWEGQVLMDAW